MFHHCLYGIFIYSMKKLTHEEFLERLPKDINYEVIGKYEDTRTKILIKNKYGKCLILPSNLINGVIPSIQSSINKIEYFINKAKVTHGDKYDYSKVNYKTNDTKIKIICKKHGEFYQQPHAHLIGQGCTKCGYIIQKTFLLSNLDSFIEKSNKIHNSLYSYENSIYKGSKIKTKITCKVHGDFEQSPNGHLRGDGCPYCNLENMGGYSRRDFIRRSKGKECIFYVLKCFNENEEFYKIGITSSSVESRYAGNNKMPYKYEVIKEIKSFDAGYIWDLELKNKRLLKIFHYMPLISFKGSVTECFSNVNILLEDIENIKI